jgi:hypothetical protein
MSAMKRTGRPPECISWPPSPQCRPSLPHHTLTSTTANMNYPGNLNLGDVRQVFGDGRAKTEWKSDALPSFSMNRGQAMANPRLQQLQSNVAGWQGGESQPPRAAWSNPYPMYGPRRGRCILRATDYWQGNGRQHT